MEEFNLKNLKRTLDMVTSWGYRDSENASNGIVFTVNTPDGLPGKVFVDVRESDGYIYEVDF